MEKLVLQKVRNIGFAKSSFAFISLFICNFLPDFVGVGVYLRPIFPCLTIVVSSTTRVL